MAQYQVTVDGEVLQQLFIRDDRLARLAEQVLNRILEAQVTEQLQAKPYERGRQKASWMTSALLSFPFHEPVQGLYGLGKPLHLRSPALGEVGPPTPLAPHGP